MPLLALGVILSRAGGGGDDHTIIDGLITADCLPDPVSLNS